MYAFSLINKGPEVNFVIKGIPPLGVKLLQICFPKPVATVLAGWVGELQEAGFDPFAAEREHASVRYANAQSHFDCRRRALRFKERQQ
jgi:hypothetical protein